MHRHHVRRVLLRALRRGFPHLGRFIPALSARLAEALFRTPPRHSRLWREERALEEAQFSRMPFGTAWLATWRWGSGPAVLLAHGWGGHGGRLTPFVGPLTEAGFSVIAFDAPGHGASPGRQSSLPEFVEAVCAIARTYGPLEAAIGHSLGAAACALAARNGIPIPRVVLLSAPHDMEKYSGRFARFYRMPVTTRDAMKRRLEQRYRFQWPDLKVAGSECRAQLLVFHDHGDGKVPFRDGLEIVRTWPNADLVRTRGLGHHRILRDPKVIARAVAFVGGTAITAGVRRRPALPLRSAPMTA
jgi:pimeloyl-ACP methyl ester carboxylesterase